jgi:hypothetical protein
MLFLIIIYNNSFVFDLLILFNEFIIIYNLIIFPKLNKNIK